MSKASITARIVVGFIALLVLMFGLEMLGLQWTKFFKPRRQSIERQVFEQTKSYTHGKIQDLAKYYREWQEGDVNERAAIEAVIKSQFAEFDKETITVPELKRFLTQTRGY